jgi:alpha-L-arabinofuranosidase
MISSKKVIREDYFDGNAGSSNIEEEKKWWNIATLEASSTITSNRRSSGASQHVNTKYMFVVR